jgi:Mg2+/Co2+ transporter CorB
LSGAYVSKFDPITQTTTTIIGFSIDIITDFRPGNNAISTNASTLVAILILHMTHESTFYQAQSRTAVVIVVVAVVAMLAEKTTSITAHCRMCSLQRCVREACVQVCAQMNIQ